VAVVVRAWVNVVRDVVQAARVIVAITMYALVTVKVRVQGGAAMGVLVTVAGRALVGARAVVAAHVLARVGKGVMLAAG